ncbi:MAG: stage II sporulation protein R [Lachnospirales bacterium]
MNKLTIKKIIQNSNFKILVIALIIATIFVFSSYKYKAYLYEKDMQENIIRLHVKGRTNNEDDQNFKLLVRDEVLNFIKEESDKTGFDLNKNRNETAIFIQDNLENIENFVNNIILKGGYDYTSQVTFALTDFPPKSYGFITLPQGVYYSLNINLGEALGNNWWCVIYPPLCYVESDTMTFDDTSIETLEENLQEDTFKHITSKNGNINMEFKILEIYDSLKNK